MQSFSQRPVQFFRSIVARFQSWTQRRFSKPVATPSYFEIASYSASIHREVTPNGVRVFSLCADCGARLNASATLCDECAQKRSRPARPY
jgi:hypothetical protein